MIDWTELRAHLHQADLAAENDERADEVDRDEGEGDRQAGGQQRDQTAEHQEQDQWPIHALALHAAVARRSV